MSQQYTAPPYQAQTQFGQQFQQRPFAQMVGQRYRESVPQEIQAAVADLDRLETVCEWATTRATESGRSQLAARINDLANVAHLEKKLLLRGSPFAEPIGQAVSQTIQQGMQELQQHAAQPEVQESLQQAQQSLNTLSQAISRVQQFGQQGVGSGQMGDVGQQRY